MKKKLFNVEKTYSAIVLAEDIDDAYDVFNRNFSSIDENTENKSHVDLIDNKKTLLKYTKDDCYIPFSNHSNDEKTCFEIIDEIEKEKIEKEKINKIKEYVNTMLRNSFSKEQEYNNFETIPALGRRLNCSNFTVHDDKVELEFNGKKIKINFTIEEDNPNDVED